VVQLQQQVEILYFLQSRLLAVVEAVALVETPQHHQLAGQVVVAVVHRAAVLLEHRAKVMLAVHTLECLLNMVVVAAVQAVWALPV
jgi:hypothetical protein